MDLKAEEMPVKSAAAVADPKAGEMPRKRQLQGMSAADLKKLKPTLFHISFFMSTGALFIVLSLLIPDTSKRFQILCWQIAMVAFFSVADIIWRHSVVWSPILRRCFGQRDYESNPAFAAAY